jgi:hypothetical protein
MVRVYAKKFYPREFRNGDLVLKKILPILGEDQSKWEPNHEVECSKWGFF